MRNRSGLDLLRARWTPLAASVHQSISHQTHHRCMAASVHQSISPSNTSSVYDHCQISSYPSSSIQHPYMYLIKTNSKFIIIIIIIKNIKHLTSYIPHQEVKRTSLIKHPTSLINPARMRTAHPHIRTERTSEHARTALLHDCQIERVLQARMEERVPNAGAALERIPGDANLAGL